MFDRLSADLATALEGKRPPRCWAVAKVWLFDNGFQAIVCYRLGSWFYRRGWPLLPQILQKTAIRRNGIDIHPGAEFGGGFAIGHGVGAVVGGNVKAGTHVILMQGVTIGGADISLHADHAMPLLEDDVVVCAGAKVLGGIRIGRGSLIAANSVVLEDIPPASVVTGIPGRVTGVWKGMGEWKW